MQEINQYNDKAQKHGYWEEYNNGIIFTKGTYKNGLYHGVWEWFFPDKKLSYRGHFKNGKKHGKWGTYSDDGRLRFEAEYKNSVYHGYYKSYTSTGNPSCEGTFINGNAHGIWTYYYSNDKRVLSTSNWNMNKKEGLRTEYNLDGTIINTQFYIL